MPPQAHVGPMVANLRSAAPLPSDASHDGLDAGRTGDLGRLLDQLEGMNVEEIRGALASALPLRPPRFETGVAPRAKVEALEDYLLASAYARAELEEALHWTDALVAHFAAKVEQITGYEAALPGKPRGRLTQADVNAAKRTVDPVTFEVGAEMRQLRTSMLRQIDRFAFEEQWVISRAYSIISGS